jgi:hypothetical protein
VTPKICIILSHKQFRRSWLDSGLVTELSGNLDVSVIGLADAFDEELGHQTFVLQERLSDYLLARLYWVNTFWSSQLHRARLNWLILSHAWWIPAMSYHANFWSRFLFLVKMFCNSVLRFFRAFPGFMIIACPKLIRDFFIFILERRQNQHAELIDLVFKLRKFDFVIVPSNSAEWFVPPLFRLLKGETTTVLAIDNWDNLTSKAVIPHRPDYLTVMGMSSVEKASRMHGFGLKQVLAFGLPKFDALVKVAKNLSQQKRPQKAQASIKIAYFGFSLPSQEAVLLNALANYARHKSPSIHIDYRPHPIRATLPIPEPEIDSSISVFRHNAEQLIRNGNAPAIDSDYVSFISSYDLIIAPPTTMAIEAMILGRPLILDLRTDDVLKTSPGNLIDVYPHLTDLMQIERLPKFKNLADCLLLVELYLKGELQFPETEHLGEIVNIQDFVRQMSSFLMSEFRLQKRH